MNGESHVRAVRHVSTMEKIKKLMLITIVFFAISLVLVGIVGLLILFKLQPDSIDLISGMITNLGWWMFVFLLIPIISLFVTYIVGPRLMVSTYYYHFMLCEP